MVINHINGKLFSYNPVFADLNEDFGFEPGSKPYIYCEVIDLGGEAVSK